MFYVHDQQKSVRTQCASSLKDIEERLPLKGATDEMYANTADSFGECSTPEAT